MKVSPRAKKAAKRRASRHGWNSTVLETEIESAYIAGWKLAAKEFKEEIDELQRHLSKEIYACDEMRRSVEELSGALGHFEATRDRR